MRNNQFFEKINHFKKNISGSFAITFAIVSLPTILAVGMAIDIAGVLSSRARLNFVMDSAVIVGVTAAQKYYNKTQLEITSLHAGAEDAGRTAALNYFKASLDTHKNIQNNLVNIMPSVNILVNESEIIANISYSADYKLAFGSLMRMDTFRVSNAAQASTEASTYLDVNIVMDTSASMGIGADEENTAKMRADPKLGCEFACHINQSTGYDDAHAIGAVLRIDVMREAIANMLSVAKKTAKKPDLFQFSLHKFSNTLETIQNKTVNYEELNTAMEDLKLTNHGGGTNFHYSIGTQLPQNLTVSGNGTTSAKRKSHVIIVTDGVENGTLTPLTGSGGLTFDPNYSLYYGNGRPYEYHAYEQAFNPAICDNIKSNGSTVSVLHVEYAIPSTIEAQNVHWYLFDFIKTQILPNSETTIQKCASDPSRYYSVNSPSEMKAAALRIFKDISAPIRLVK